MANPRQELTMTRSPVAQVSRTATVSLAMAIGSVLAGAHAQESLAIFDAPLVVRGENDAPFSRLIDLAGDGWMDSVGTKVNFEQDQRVVSLFRNSGTGSLFITSWSQAFTDTASTPESELRDQVVVGDFEGTAAVPDFVVAFGTRVRIYTTSGFTASLDVELATPSPVLSAVTGNFKRGATQEFALLMADELWIESHDASGWHTQSASVPLHDWAQLEKAELT